jgi:hypothetical protein
MLISPAIAITACDAGRDMLVIVIGGSVAKSEL